MKPIWAIMSSDDPFTSVQWDRDDTHQLANTVPPIIEETLGSQHSSSSPMMAAADHVESVTEPVSSSLSIGGDDNSSHKGDDEVLKDLTHSDFKEPIDALQQQQKAEKEEQEQEQEEEVQEEQEVHDLSGHLLNPAVESIQNNDNISSAVDEAQQCETTTDEFAYLRKLEEKFSKYKLTLEVSNPIFDKDPNGKLYISYLIVTETDHPDVKRLQKKNPQDGVINIKVRRRYRDFRFLSACLTSDFPLLLVPPLPPKLNFKYLTGDTFSKSFVHKRLFSLARFVEFICEHKILSQLAVFHYFLSDSTEWSTFTKNLKISKSGSANGLSDDAEPLIVGKVVNEELLTETVMNFFTSSKHKRETNKDILEISDKLKKLYENLVKLDKIFARLNKKNSDLKTDYEQFLVQVNRLASIQLSTSRANDNGNLDPNSSFTTGASFDGTLAYAANCKVFSESLLFFLEKWGELYQYIDEAFLVSLKDCAKYIIKFSDLIELQHNKKIDLQVLQEYLEKARSELATLGGATANALNGASHHAPIPSPALINHNRGGLVNSTTQLIKDTLSTSATPHIGSTQSDLKKAKLEQRIHSLESEIVAQTKVVNAVTSQIVNEEYPNWDRYNKKQLKQSMVDLCEKEISFYKDLLQNWKSAELKLAARLEELS